MLALLLAATLGGTAEDAVAATRALLDRQQEAWNREDLDGFLAGYWDSPEVVFQSGGDRIRGFAEVKRRYERRYREDGKAMGRLAFREVEVEPLGDGAALARGRWGLEMPDGSRPGGLFTVVLRKLPEGWRIVHDHTSSADHVPPAAGD
jgi:beta-aspartyl-peptidase (threonine type)